MKANPGGLVDPSSVFGRDELIGSMWEILEQQSIRLTAERRIGKTSIIRKMQAEPRAGWFPVFQDLESVHTPEQFARQVFEVVHRYLRCTKRVANRAKQVLKDSNVRVAGVSWRYDGDQVCWQDLVTNSIENLVAERRDERLVLFWDEVPFMIDNIRRVRGEDVAAEVLDMLRGLRQTYADFRVVFTGSIGLHHVLTRLKAQHIATEPVNDMYPVEVTPLAPEHARRLAAALLAGERITAPNRQAAAEAIAEQADCFPFYMQHIVRCLKSSAVPATPASVAEIVGRQLVDANDPWQLAHYRTRIKDYYQEGSDAERVAMILDILAAGSEPMKVRDIFARMQNQSAQLTRRDHLLELLRLMERDHYLSRDLDGRYRFRFPLIRRWWRLDRGL